MGEKEKQGVRWFAGVLISTALVILTSTGASYISTMNRMERLETHQENQYKELDRFRSNIEKKVDREDYYRDVQEVKQDIKEIKNFLINSR
jgi:peptidoglycan hydrolase CwlO-like protein